MKLATLLLASAVCALPLAAAAQWQWVDKDGRKVFSDQSPPPDIPEKNILRRPAGKASTLPAAVPATPAAAAPTPAAPVAAGTGTGAPKVSGQDKELLEKAKQEKDAELAKQKEAEAKQKAALAENCRRARAAQASLDSGMRLAQVNAKGEREVMDDAARAAESRRVQSAIAENCKG